MILIDTSVWIDHLARPIPHLLDLIESSEYPPILTHPFVIGELACGKFPTRTETLAGLRRLRQAVRASDQDVLTLIERHALMGRGIGLVDVHLLASTLVTPETRLWTHDKRLERAAGDLSIAYRPTAPEEG